MAAFLALPMIVKLILGFLAALGVYGITWNLKEDEDTLQEREQTRQDEIASLQSIIDNPDLPQDVRENAAERLTELTGTPTGPGDDGGNMWEGIANKAIIGVVVAVIVAALVRK